MTQLVTFKLKETVLKEIDKIASLFGFTNRTEFIRTSLREKVEEYKLKQALLNLSKNKGFAKNKKISDRELEKIKEQTFSKLLTKFR